MHPLPLLGYRGLIVGARALSAQGPESASAQATGRALLARSESIVYSPILLESRLAKTVTRSSMLGSTATRTCGQECCDPKQAIIFRDVNLTRNLRKAFEHLREP